MVRRQKIDSMNGTDGVSDDMTLAKLTEKNNNKTWTVYYL